jgi:hypothetical protein
MYRLFLALLLAPALAGCATVANTLSADQVASFRLTGVNVGFTPDAKIAWGDGELAYAASKGVASHESGSVANTPEGKAYLRNAVASKLKPAMQESLAGRLNGSRSVRVDVTVKEVFVSSVVQRVAIGGSHLIIGDVNLVDAKSGEVLAAKPGVIGIMGAGAGVLGVVVDGAFRDEPIDGVTRSFASVYGTWLLRN